MDTRYFKRLHFFSEFMYVESLEIHASSAWQRSHLVSMISSIIVTFVDIFLDSSKKGGLRSNVWFK